MAQVAQGSSVTVQLAKHTGLWVRSTGSAKVTVSAAFAGTVYKQDQFFVGASQQRIGFYDFAADVVIEATTGAAEYEDNPFTYEPLKAEALGDSADSTALDVALTVNGLQSGKVPFSNIQLEGLPNTPGAPAGYGDLASAMIYAQKLNSQFARKLYAAPSQINRIAVGEVGQFRIGFIGDSWTQAPQRYPNLLAKLIQKYAGFSAGGYCGFSYPDSDTNKAYCSARNDLYQVTITGTTTAQHIGQNFPDMGRIEMSAGSNINLTYPAGTSTAKLYYTSTAGASVEYRINGGAWTSISLASGGATGAAIPVPSTAGNLDIRYQAGTVRLGGINFESAASGVVVHKLGASGSNTGQWAALPVNWQTITANLGITSWVIMLGTNDLQNNVAPSAYKSNMQTIIANCRAASTSDATILLVSAPEVPAATGNTYTRRQYLQMLEEIAAADPFIDLIDLQPAFGVSPSDYSSTSNYPLMHADNIHPDPLGAFVIAMALDKTLKA